MHFSAVAGLQLLAVAAAKYIEVLSGLGTYYLQASEGRYILTDDIKKAYGNFSVNGRVQGVDELGVTRDNRVLDGGFYTLLVGLAAGFFRGEYIILNDDYWSWYVCQDPVTPSGDWLLYIKDSRFNYSDYSSVRTALLSDEMSTSDMGVVSSSLDLITSSDVTGLSSSEDLGGSSSDTVGVSSSEDLGVPSSLGGPGSDVSPPTALGSPSTDIVDTNTESSTGEANTDTGTGIVPESSTSTEQIPAESPDTAANIGTPQGGDTAAQVPSAEEAPTTAEISLAIETALRLLLKEKREEPFYPVNYDQCYEVSLLLVDEPLCVGSDCGKSSNCSTQCSMFSCSGSPCYPEICTTRCPGNSCPTVCSKTLCEDNASCPPDICTSTCGKDCLTICPLKCSSGALCTQGSCTTKCVGDCDVICEAGCTGSACSRCTTSCGTDCSGTSCPCTGPLCPGGQLKGNCTTCGGDTPGGNSPGGGSPGGGTVKCTGLSCKPCTTCDKTVVFPGCPTCVYTFTDFVFTCPSVTTLTISTCTKTSICSAKVVTFSPGTHTISGTAVVPVKTDISLTIRAGGNTGTGTSKASGTSGSSGGSGSTTAGSGGSTKGLVGTFIGALGLFILLW